MIIISTILFYFKVKCPVGCAYCFEKPTDINEYDLKTMLKTFEQIYKRGDTVCLHGGEICTLPIEDLDFVLNKIRTFLTEKESSMPISVQTSLYGFTNEHLNLFKKYNVSPGVSVDGPPELNVLRGPRDTNKNKEYQQDLLKNLQTLKNEKIFCGRIAVLSKANVGTDEKLEKFIEWAISTNFNGRMNPMFSPVWDSSTKDNQALTPKELTKVWLKLAEVCVNNKTLMWNPFREFIDNLLGQFHLSPCIISRCDYLTTTCETIMGDGSLARCDRCFQEGYFGRGNDKNFIRSEALKNTECNGCKYFEICGGGCPGEGKLGDARHKTYYCESYYAVYEYLENCLRGLMPNITLSVDIPNYFDEFDRQNKKLEFFEKFSAGTWRTPPPKEPKESVCNLKNNGKTLGCRPHGDHYDENHYNNIKAKDHGDRYDN